MKVPLSALREWVELPWAPEELERRLTQAGFEIEARLPVAPPFRDVVVARILKCAPHPHAARLQICEVSTGAGPLLQIVCGAANARAGLVSALARIGAVLPDGQQIRAAQLRGVESQGMLCSAKELGLAESSTGILELPEGLELGADLRVALDLDDTVLEINVTPNRGDAMSVLGIAREIVALSGTALRWPRGLRADLPVGSEPPDTTSKRANDWASDRASGQPGAAVDAVPVRLTPAAGAARLVAGALFGLDNTRASPWWLTERLRRSGLRAISPVVDITNFVMLELGQPMHAYDRQALEGGGLVARRGLPGERLQLLDGRDVEVDAGVLVIADGAGAVGLAGIMGGARTAIAPTSRDIVFEAAWFAPAAIAGRARRYGLTTDAGQRFERGVDYRGQERALSLATQLTIEIAGGSAGPVTVAELADELPVRAAVTLRAPRLERLLGARIEAVEVEQRLRGLGMRVERRETADAWSVTPPSWRFDITIEPDLIEEVVRIGGFESIQERDAAVMVALAPIDSSMVPERVVLEALTARGFQEVISFAFVDPALQRQLFPDRAAIELANPIAADLAVMRSSLWPGLINAARENLRRQQDRVRLFEIASRFLAEPGTAPEEQKMLAALALGTRAPEQWASAAATLDFFDLKGELEALLALTGGPAEFRFEPASVTCLHPGRSARVLRSGIEVGTIGELHPRLCRALGFTATPILLEVDFHSTFRTQLAKFREVSRFPQVRRDLSFTVPETIAFRDIGERVNVAASSLLQELRLFDVYQGKGVESGRKSVALGLILQDLHRTLTDEDADRIVAAVRADLQTTLDARIRE
jgi:phenylalanyl-tRNA synthetase beta chain